MGSRVFVYGLNAEQIIDIQHEATRMLKSNYWNSNGEKAPEGHQFPDFLYVCHFRHDVILVLCCCCFLQQILFDLI